MSLSIGLFPCFKKEMHVHLFFTFYSGHWLRSNLISSFKLDFLYIYIVLAVRFTEIWLCETA